MNLYQFLKIIQEGIGDGCGVRISLWTFMKQTSGVVVELDWPNDLHCRFVLPEKSIENEGFLEHFSRYTIDKAKRDYMLATVGEE